MNFSKLIQSPKSCDLFKSNRSTLIWLSSTSTMTIFNQPPPWLIHCKWRQNLQPTITMACPSQMTTTGAEDTDASPAPGMFFLIRFFSINYLQLDYVYGTWNNNKALPLPSLLPTPGTLNRCSRHWCVSSPRYVFLLVFFFFFFFFALLIIYD